MAIYEFAAEVIRPIVPTTFADAGLPERAGLQRLLRAHIDVICPGTLVIAEEFCEWEDSRRRVDLLGLDKDANLIVIELKTTEDGGHMELQAIRYAAMVSAMTFEQAVEVYARHLARLGRAGDARTEILDFLEWESPDEDRFAQDVRIVLAAADFSKELTTAVMWLNDRDLDIRCVRIAPYDDNGRLLVDVQQVVPLPEAADYVVKLKEKVSKERDSRKEQEGNDETYRRFWTLLLSEAKAKTALHANIFPPPVNWLARWSKGTAFCYVLRRGSPRVELYIARPDRDENKRIFDRLLQQKVEIERRFDGPLHWERLEDGVASRVYFNVGFGSLKDESQWPVLREALVTAMIQLEQAIRPSLDLIDQI